MEQAILVVSFGTSYQESRIKNIEAVEQAIRAEFPGWEMGTAFTSRVIIRLLQKRDGILVDGVSEALEKLAEKGCKRVVIQPVLVMEGEEYDRMREEAKPYENRFDRMVWGKPLLSEEQDYLQLSEILAKDTCQYNREGTEILFMGHGTEHGANAVYDRLAVVFQNSGHARYHIGTVEAEPSFETLEQEVCKTGSGKILLQPLMIVAGDHAHNDMAGEGPGSWKSRLKARGFEVVCRLKGMGELEGVRRMFVEHAREARKKLENMVR